MHYFRFILLEHDIISDVNFGNIIDSLTILQSFVNGRYPRFFGTLLIYIYSYILFQKKGGRANRKLKPKWTKIFFSNSLAKN